MEYERCKDEYEEKKNKLTELYDLQKQTREKPCNMQKAVSVKSIGWAATSRDIGEICNIWWNKREAGRASRTRTNAPQHTGRSAENRKQTEYFNMELLSLIHVTYVGEQFENISDMISTMNLLPSDTKPQIRPRKKYVPAIWYSWWAKNCPNRTGRIGRGISYILRNWGPLLTLKLNFEWYFYYQIFR